MNLIVDTLTGFYARDMGLPSRFWNGSMAGQQTGHFPAHPSPPSRAISVGTDPMIAIPVADNVGPVAMIVGQTPQVRCNERGHGPPSIAIRAADDCDPLYIATPVLPRHHRQRQGAGMRPDHRGVEAAPRGSGAGDTAASRQAAIGRIAGLAATACLSAECGAIRNRRLLWRYAGATPLPSNPAITSARYCRMASRPARASSMGTPRVANWRSRSAT